MNEQRADTIGRRIAYARKRRGLTQRALADLVPCSKSLIAQVERGHKPASSSLVAAVARVLDVDVTELTGQPYRGHDAQSDRVHAAIPQLRQALTYGELPPDLDVPPRTPTELAADVDHVTQLRQAARYMELGTLLPALIKELTVAALDATGSHRARLFALLATAYSAADSMTYKLGYLDLFHVAVERVAWAASQSDDPLLPAVSEVRRSMAFMASAAWDGGLKLLDRTSSALADGTGDQARISVSGTVHLRAAILAARGGMASVAYDHMGQAREAAVRLGRDTKDYGLLFGPSNVAIHDVAVAVELGDADEAIRRSADIELPKSLPAERSSHHYIDLSRAWLWTGKRDRALSCVLTAEKLAPQRTRYHPMARETIARLVEIQRRIPEPLRGVAHRMRITDL